MSLRFIYGRAGSGKSHFCFNDIKERLKGEEDTPLILIVPEQFSFQAEKNLLKIVGEKNILRAEVLSFKRMAHKIFNEVGGLTRQHMDAAGKSMLIYRIIDRLKDELNVFGKAVKQQGFTSIISDTITEMKRYSITPDMLKAVGEGIKDELLKNKIKDIELIYDEFERDLHEKYIDSEDDLTLLGEKLDKSNMFKGAEIWLDEFSSFTPQEYTVIEKLLRSASRVNITLCTDSLSTDMFDDTDVFSPVKNTCIRLFKIADENGIRLEKSIGLSGSSRFKSSPEIEHLEEHLFSFPYRQFSGKTENISLFKSVNKYTEVEEAAREIVRLCRDKGFRYRDIAVVTRDLAGYENLIKAIFNEYDIPYFIDEKRNIVDNPLVLLITSAVEILTKRWAYEPVFRYLKTGLLDIDGDEVDILENYVLANGIKGYRWTEDKWSCRLNPGFGEDEISEYEQSVISRVNETKNKITPPLLKFYSRVQRAGNAEKLCAALYEFLCDTGIPEKIEKLVEEFKANGEFDLASEYSQIWNMIMGVLDQIVEVLGEEEITLDQFLKILSSGLQEYSIGLIPPALDQVLVGSVERLKSHEINALYIIGVNDGIFPQARADEGILNDNDREYLKSAGIELASGTKTKAFEEQFMIYTTLTAAGKYLRLSYPIADHEGKSMRPSIIISRIKKLYPHITELSNIVEKSTEEENVELISGPKATFKELVSAIRREHEGFNVHPLWSDVKNWYVGKREWKGMVDRMASALDYSNNVKLADPEKVRRLYGKEMYFSVSRIEKYAECPFSYFVQYGLRAKDRKVFEISAPDLGTFIHDVIDRFSRVIDENSLRWREIDRDWCTNTVSDIVEDMLEEQTGSILSSSKRYRYIAERLKRILARAVWLIALHIKRSGFEPIGYEMSFGINGEFPPITIELSSGEKINLIGRIDRIDSMETENGTYVRVVDYKSGNKAFKLSDVYHGLQIQLLVYLDAMLSNIGSGRDKPAIPGGVLYFHVDDPIIKTKSDRVDEEIEKEIMKKLKMKGLLLADKDIIKEMDREMEGNSLIIPARVNKDGTLGKSSAATQEQFAHLREHVRNKLTGLCEEMAEGNINIEPYKKKKFTPCGYCRFDSICKFDTGISDNKYRIIGDKSDDEIWQLIAQGIQEGSKNE